MGRLVPSMEILTWNYLFIHIPMKLRNSNTWQTGWGNLFKKWQSNQIFQKCYTNKFSNNEPTVLASICLVKHFTRQLFNKKHRKKLLRPLNLGSPSAPWGWWWALAPWNVSHFLWGTYNNISHNNLLYNPALNTVAKAGPM